MVEHHPDCALEPPHYRIWDCHPECAIRLGSGPPHIDPIETMGWTTTEDAAETEMPW